MIRRRLFAVLLCSVGTFAFMSCGSTPQEEPAPVQEENVVEETPQIEENVPEKDFGDDNKSLLAAVEASRKLAKEAGAENANPAAFAAAEADYEAQKVLIEGGAAGDLSAALKDLNSRYMALAALADAKAKKERIDREGYASYDQKSYDAGVKLLDKLSGPELTVLAGDAQLKQAKAASSSFDAVLNAAFKSLAKDARKKAVAAKKNADSVKAAVSRKADYDKAVKLVTDGDSQFVTGAAEQAVGSYEKAASSFTSLYEEISERRAKAQKAIEEAKKRVSESESNAIAADGQFPLGDEPVEGIVDENTQLLEADDFSAQENAAVVLSDDIADEAGDAK